MTDFFTPTPPSEESPTPVTPSSGSNDLPDPFAIPSEPAAQPFTPPQPAAPAPAAANLPDPFAAPSGPVAQPYVPPQPQPVQAPPQAPSGQAPKKSNTWLIVLIVGILLMCCCCLLIAVILGLGIVSMDDIVNEFSSFVSPFLVLL